jgi:hypothetical protein
MSKQFVQGSRPTPEKGACVLFAVLPPKNGDSTGAKAFSAQGFAIA